MVMPMRYNDVIYLRVPEYTEDELGQKIPTGNYTDRMIYANQMGITSSEFYEASISGLKPEKRFEIRSFEYQGESLLKFGEQVYNIIQTSQKGEKLTITCERDANNG